ncbi:MAG: hypothetical protein PF551_06300 [Candidatus Marinimicrobia bacterium]|jgi:hypothetical protein|nr:hypothetical protein [Candidatus Neomarinimicrobiota bacterium]
MTEQKNKENKVSEKFEDVKKGLGNWWTKRKPKFQEMAKTAGEKATIVKEKGRVKYNLFQEKRNMGKLFSELGEKVFDEINDNQNYVFSKNDDVKEIVKKIVAEKKVIKKYGNEYDNIDASIKEDKK